MEARRLLIAENNEALRLSLAQRLQTFHYVRCCRTGPEALALIRRERPELLVLSMDLPELDGLTILETIVAEGIHPMVLVTTTYRSDYLEASAYRLGVCAILLKPFPLESIVRRVLDMKHYLKSLPEKLTPEQMLEQLLLPLGIRSNTGGYHLLEMVLVLMAREPGSPLCKSAYLDTARHFGTTTLAVESAIRRIVDSCWDPESWQVYFPDTTRQPKPKQFLSEMARLLRERLE